MSDDWFNLLWGGTLETLYMVGLAGSIAIIVGLPLGMLLFMTRQGSLRPSRLAHNGLSVVVNITRSVPFIILLIALIPLTRLVVGSSIGTNAAIVPLSIGAIPFYARIAESALAEVNFGLIEAGYSMGASKTQILLRILLPESLPSLINGITLMVIALVGYSAMAGTVGGGGLGSVAINYGYQRFDTHIMLATVVILVVIVYMIQGLGDWLVRRCDKSR